MKLSMQQPSNRRKKTDKEVKTLQQMMKMMETDQMKMKKPAVIAQVPQV